jgi:hypothetical protein
MCYGGSAARVAIDKGKVHIEFQERDPSRLRLGVDTRIGKGFA